jgi:hypothetical protein
MRGNMVVVGAGALALLVMSHATGAARAAAPADDAPRVVRPVRPLTAEQVDQANAKARD